MGFIADTLGSIGLTEVVIQFMLINAILGISIYLTLYGGMFSLANAGFMAIGAYVSVILTQTYGWSLLPALVMGAIAAGLISIPVGLPVLRLNDIYLAIATIGFGEVVRVVILNFDTIIKEIYTLLKIDQVYDLYELLQETFNLPKINGDPPKVTFGALGITGIPSVTRTEHLVIALIILSYFLIRLHHSRFGRALAAIRQDESVAANLGINVVYYKNAAFILGAIIAGLAGGFHGHLVRVVSPDKYEFSQAVVILAFAVLGGTTVWYGPILGGLVLTAIPEILRPLQQYRGIIIGLVLLFFVIYLPKGLSDPDLWQSLWQRIRRPREESG